MLNNYKFYFISLIFVLSSSFYISCSNDDGASSDTVTEIKITMSSDNLNISEQGGSAVLTFALSGNAIDSVIIKLNIKGNAGSNDYLIDRDSIVIEPGSNSGSISITAVDDSEVETDETIIVEIETVINGIEDGVQTVTITIEDDDTISVETGTITDTIEHGGLLREFILYVPVSYTGSEAVPLLFNFHGHWGTMAEHMEKGDFRDIADTAGFIIVHPQGTLDNLGDTYWNVTSYGPGSSPDDIGFVGSLLDTISARYNIDSTRVYAAGMSMGGFMSYLIACQLSDKFAAVASVTGSMRPYMLDDCNTTHPMPILEIHGTNDVSVPYEGANWTEPIDTVLQFWISFNNCSPVVEITVLPDLDSNDGSTVEYHKYSGGDNGATIEHFKVIGGTHSWPGGGYTYYQVNFDIDASEEIWKFFSKFDIHGTIQ